MNELSTNMDPKMEQLLKRQRLEYVFVFLLLVLTVLLGESGIIPNGLLAVHSQEYMVQSVLILLMLIGLPLSFRLGSEKTNKALDNSGLDENLCPKHRRYLLRLLIVAILAIASLCAYYLTLSSTCTLCTAICVLFLIALWPRRTFVKTCENSSSDDPKEEIR